MTRRMQHKQQRFFVTIPDSDDVYSTASESSSGTVLAGDGAGLGTACSGSGSALLEAEAPGATGAAVSTACLLDLLRNPMLLSKSTSSPSKVSAVSSSAAKFGGGALIMND